MTNLIPTNWDDEKVIFYENSTTVSQNQQHIPFESFDYDQFKVFKELKCNFDKLKKKELKMESELKDLKRVNEGLKLENETLKNVFLLQQKVKKLV